MPRALRRALLATAVLLAGVAPGPAQAANGVPACATGRASGSETRATLDRLLNTERRHLRARLHDVPPARARAAGDVLTAGIAAYVYGFPDVLLRRTVATFPRNQMVSIAELASPRTRTVVAPNHDTLYSVAQIDLADGPMVLQTPPTGGRYSVIQLLDTFTNAFAYLGDGAGARTGETVALVPPGWRGTLPGGVTELPSPSEVVWLLGRTLVDGDEDVASARELMAQYAMTPLAEYVSSRRRATLVLDAFPAGREAVRVPAGVAFFDELGAALAADPPPARDACALRGFRIAGVGPGRAPGRAATGLGARALRAAAAAGPRVLGRLVAAGRSERAAEWTALPANTGRFATDYATRAVVARVGLGANTVEQALYPTTSRDSRGRRLDGRHGYSVRFAPGALPPVDQFWSLTLYGSRLALVDNPLGRFAIGDRTRGLRRDRDGGLTIRVSHGAPAGRARPNWLPAPVGRFSLYLRLYEPKPAASSGRWRPPPVVRVG